jgi:ABC-type branched-subunit amino acid transport system ATPase component/ABC-type branched-subunit amino acid transport system permease subunit
MIRAAALRRPTVRTLLPVVLIGALALVPLTGEFPALVGSLAVIFSLVALSFVILTGWTGDVSLGQVVPYGLGAYGTFVLSDRAGIPVALAVLIAAVATVPLLVLIGTPALRLRGLDLAIATFALALVFQVLAFPAISRRLAGGRGGGVTDFSSAVVQVTRPTLLHTNRAFYVAVLLTGALVVAAVAALGRSPFGLALRAVRDDPIRAAAIGIGVGRHRLAAFVISGVIAAFAGGMVAALRQAITPATFNIFESLNFLAFAVIGGVTAPLGAILGGIVGAGLPELTRVDPFRFLQGHLVLVYGAALVVLLALQPDGLAGALGWNRRRPVPLPDPEPPVPRLVGDDDTDVDAGGRGRGPALLDVEDVVVRYGGVRAVDGVSFTVRDGEALALIGPNGAGKSSLFDALSGFVRPAAGAVRFEGRDITRLRPERRAGGGLGRTFQMAHTFPDLTVAENLLAAAHAAGNGRRSAGTVHWLLRRLDLADRAADRPAALPFGALRRLEVGLALAAQPRLLLLDEPTAGMGAADADALCELLDDLRVELGLAVLLVEHDMAVVGRLAQRVIVLDQGAILAEGTVAEVAADPAVVTAYLGTNTRILVEDPPLGGRRARRP